MAAKDDQPVLEKTQDKSKKKMLIIIIGSVVLVAVVAVSAFYLFKGGSSKESAPKAEQGEKAEKTEKGEKGEASNMYALDPFIVNIYDGQELRYLKLKLEVELSGAEVKNELTARQAELRDAVLAILTTKTMQDIQFLQGKNQLKQEIMAAVTKMLSPGKVKQIYFTDFVVQ
jgi:flagellar FliL protein